MAQTPYAETEALLAVMSEDEDEALRILGDMLPGERRELLRHLGRLSLLADDRQRCPRCGKVADPLTSVTRVADLLGGLRKQWRFQCLEAHRAEERKAS